MLSQCDGKPFRFEFLKEWINKRFSQETYNFHILGNDTMIIADYKDIRISSFHLLVLKLWLKEDQSSWVFFQIRSFKSVNLPQNSAFFKP